MQEQKTARLPIRIIQLRSKFFLDNKIRPLFVSLLLLLILSPFLAQRAIHAAALSALVSVVLLSGVSALSMSHRHHLVSLFLLVPTLGTTWAAVFLPSPVMQIANLGFTTAFYAYVTAIVLNYVLKAKQITKDEIIGAICVYLLIGVVWGTLFAFMESLSPGSFYVDPTRHGTTVVGWTDFLYYSFVTLTTTGYGDITPISPVVQSLAILESSFGVLYVAVLVARLVGLYNPQPAALKPKMRDFKLDEFIKRS